MSKEKKSKVKIQGHSAVTQMIHDYLKSSKARKKWRDLKQAYMFQRHML